MKTFIHNKILQGFKVAVLLAAIVGVTPASAQYDSSYSNQNTVNCFPGMNNAMILEVVVQTSGTASVLTSMNFTTNGTNDVGNIEAAKLFQSNGGSFTTMLQSGQQVGSSVTSPNGSFSFSGFNIALDSGANKFFLVYDLPYSATLGDSLDAECTGVTVDGNGYTPLITAPIGARYIVTNTSYAYCSYPVINVGTYQIGISSLQFGSQSLSNTIPISGTVQTNTTTVFDLVKDLNYTVTYRGGSGYTQNEKFYIDLNNDGFFDESEIVMSGSTPATAQSTNAYFVGCNLENGIHRMRVVTDYTGIVPYACGTSSYGSAFEVNVNIQDASAPVASFTAPTQAYRAAYVDYLNTSQGLGFNYEWDFENDGNVDATSVNGKSQYSTVGVKTVFLKMSRTSCGTPLADNTSRQITIIDPTAVPTSEFIANRNVTNQTLEVQFRDLSSQGANKWHWKITPEDVNGAPAYVYVNGTDSTSQHPEVLFLALGYYNVEFYSENVLGAGNYVTKPNYISNISINDFCVTTFTSESSGFIADEGGVFSSYPNWAGTGKLCGFLIQPSCAASISFNFLDFDMSSFQVNQCFIPGSNPQVLQPFDHVKVYDGVDNTGIPLHVAAGFPNGFSNGPANTPLAQLPPTVTATSGSMFIEYSVNCGYNGRGFLAEWSSTAKILPAPVTAFEGDDTVYINAPYIYSNTTTGDYDEIAWDYDNDGLTDFTGVDADITFDNAGTQVIKLTMARCGNEASFTKTVHVLAPTSAPGVDFSTARTSAIVLDTLRLIDISSNGPNAWKWTITPSADIVFVNGTSATSRNPYIRFNKIGMYEVKLWAANGLGADSLVRSSYIGIFNYCTPNVVNQSSDIGMSRVNFAGIDRSSPVGETGYMRYTDNASVQQGATYPITIDRTTNFNNVNYKVWIDFNKNGTFTDAGEEVFVQTSTSALQVIGSVVIPRNAPLGSTRMRIGANSESNPNLSCGPNEFGEFEDYQVVINRDNTKPIITLIGSSIFYMEQGYVYNDLGATAFDNADGDLTAKLQINTNLNVNQVGQYWISFNVTDTAGNKADSVVRMIVVEPDGSGPAITLNGGDTVYHPVNTVWVDPGASALDFVDGVIGTIITTGTVNHTLLGTYYLSYSASDLQGNIKTVQRVVIVSDNVAPVLTLVGNDPFVLDFGSPFADPGVSVADNYYTGLAYTVTGIINVMELGTTLLTYNAVDPSGNVANGLTRVVEVKDISAPKIKLVGLDTVLVDVFDSYIELGAVVTDNHTKGLSAVVTGTVNTNVLGDYSLVYTATDSIGNVSTKNRLVRVVDREIPVITLKGSSLIQMNRFDAVPDPGIHVSDNYDSEASLLTNGLTILNGVVTDIEGLYPYCYQVTDNSGNKSAQVCRLVSVGPADPNALTNASNEPVTIYPNPTVGSFQINVPQGLKIESIKIYNATGALVKIVEATASNQILADLEDAAPGIYYVVVNANGKMYSTKMSYIK